jgi:hypothetical protein
MLQSLPPLTGDRAGESLAKAAGFSLHAGVATQAHQRNKLERVARYIMRPTVAIERLSLTSQGHYIECSLKTPYRDGTTHVIFEPLDFIARLVPDVSSNASSFLVGHRPSRVNGSEHHRGSAADSRPFGRQRHRPSRAWPVCPRLGKLLCHTSEPR